MELRMIIQRSAGKARIYPESRIKTVNHAVAAPESDEGRKHAYKD
jgi:hypothetical protein